MGQNTSAARHTLVENRENSPVEYSENLFILSYLGLIFQQGK
jgi:hypothetical protein